MTIINAGAELYEVRVDTAIKSVVEVPPVKAEFVALHTKAVVVDRRYVFIGSMNLDPRSRNTNTEAGAFVDSPALASDVAALMERDMASKTPGGCSSTRAAICTGSTATRQSALSPCATSASASWL